MGFKGGFAAFTDSFMRTMDAENERKRLEVERADQKSRQAENDQWTRDERALQVKNRTEAEDVKKKLIEASAPVVEDVAQHGPVTPSMELPPIQVSRPKMLDEKLDSIATVLEGKGDMAEALKYQALSDSEKMRRSAKGFMDLQASAKDATPDQLINSAIGIFNNDPSLGHIENQKKNDDGTYTMDIFNKKTGQRVTQTFKPEDILTGLRMHYDQAGALKSHAEDLERSRKITSHREGSTLTDGNGRIVGMVPKLQVGGINGRPDHFDAKQWDAAAKIPSSIVSLPNAMGDKEVEDGNLRAAYMQIYNGAKASGTMAPNEAAEHATTTIVRLKGIAQDRVDKAFAADSKSPLTINQAVRDILRESAQRQAAQQKPTAPPGQPNATEQQMRANASGDMGADPKAIARELHQAALDLQKVKDPGSQAQLRVYIAELQRQQASLGAR